MTPTEKAIRGFCGRHADWWPSTTQVQEMLALAQPEQDNTYIYASSLATAIWQKHYMKESPKFALFDTTEGVLTQIDNMTCGLVREKLAQPEQEPVADDFFRMIADKNPKPFPLPQRTWVGLTDDEIMQIWGGIIKYAPSEVRIKYFARAIESKLKEVNA